MMKQRKNHNTSFGILVFAACLLILVVLLENLHMFMPVPKILSG